MNDKNNDFLGMFLKHTKRGLLMMAIVIFLSIAAALVFYLTTPDAELSGSLGESAGTSEIDKGSPASDSVK